MNGIDDKRGEEVVIIFVEEMIDGYINSLEEVNLEVLESLIQQSVEAMQSGNVEL